MSNSSQSQSRSTPVRFSRSPWVVNLFVGVAVCLGYWLAAQVGLAFVPAGRGITPVWPPNGVVIGLLVVLSWRRWPWVGVGVAAAVLGSNLFAGRGGVESLAFTLANVFEVFAGALFFRRFGPPHATLSTRAEAGLIGVLAGPVYMLTALVGGAVGAYIVHGQFRLEWEKWWLGSAVGTLLFTPATILAANLVRHWRPLRAKRVIEGIFWLALHAGLCVLVFYVVPAVGNTTLLSTAMYPYLTLVTLNFITVRFGPIGSVSACVVGALIALSSLSMNYGDPAAVTSDLPLLITTQAYLAISALLGLYLGAQREERLITRRALRESEERFRLLALNAPSGIFLCSLEGECTYVNEACSEMTGRPEEQLLGLGWIECFHPDDRERALALWAKCAEDGTEFQMEYRFLRPDGGVTWVIGLASPVRAGHAITGFVGTLTDITPLKEAEAKLRESEARFHQMADSSPGMIWLTNELGEREYFNRAWLSFRGRTTEEERGEGWKEGIHPDDREQVEAILSAAVRDQRPVSAEYRLRRYDGTYAYVMGSAVPRYTHDGKFLGFVGTCMDFTTLREAQNERLAMQAQLQEAARVESIARLAGGVAHEFNNLLTGVLGNANLAQLEPGLSQDVRDYLARIEEGSLKAAELTRKMLSFSGRAPSVRSLQSITAVVEETMPLLRATMPKIVQLNLHLAHEVPSIVADPAQVQQVLANLVTNAVEALDASGGSIAVSTGANPFDEQALRKLDADEDLVEGDYVFVRVADNGCGIAPENLTRVFDPFFSTKFLGRGLGLAAIQGIIRGHGGWIHVDSTPGQGSTFTAWFPATARPTFRVSASATPAEIQG